MPRAGVRGAVPVGVDGCRAGWLAVMPASSGARGDRREVRAAIHASFEALLAWVRAAASASVIAVDIPIGLPTDGPRACDVEARGRLGVRRSSLFPAPPRTVLEASDYRDALARCRATTGVGLSKQAWFLVPKIREVDAMLRGGVPDGVRVMECHPETSFAAWAGAPMAEPKRTAAGRAAREALIERWWPGAVKAASLSLGRRTGRWQGDDLLDAIAAGWTAARIGAGESEVLGGQIYV